MGKWLPDQMWNRGDEIQVLFFISFSLLTSRLRKVLWRPYCYMSCTLVKVFFVLNHNSIFLLFRKELLAPQVIETQHCFPIQGWAALYFLTKLYLDPITEVTWNAPITTFLWESYNYRRHIYQPSSKAVKSKSSWIIHNFNCCQLTNWHIE